MKFDVETRRKQLLDAAFEFGQDFYRVNERFAPLRSYAAKYAKAFLKIGYTLVDALKEDPRFKLTMIPGTAGYYVETSLKRPLDDLIVKIVKDAGGVTSVDNVKVGLKGSGYTLGDFAESLVSLQERQVLEAQAGQLKLTAPEATL